MFKKKLFITAFFCAFCVNIFAVEDSDLAKISRHKARGYLVKDKAFYREKILAKKEKLPFSINIPKNSNGLIKVIYNIEQPQEVLKSRQNSIVCSMSLLNAQNNALTYQYVRTHSKKFILPAQGKGCYIPSGTTKLEVGCRIIDETKNVKLRNAIVTYLVPQITIVSPFEGQIINDNTPDFYWQTFADNSILEICQDENFSASPVFNYKVSKFQAKTIPDKLKAGKWFYRVKTADNVYSKVVSFTQIAPLGKDCDAPILYAKPTFIKNKQDSFIFKFYKDGTIKNIVGKYCNETLSGKIIAPNVIELTAPKGGWKKGVEKLRIEVSDTANNVGVSQVYISHSPNLQQVVWNNRGIKIDGINFFPVGSYIVRKFEMAAMKEKGINFVQHYGADLTTNNNYTRQWLDKVANYNLKAMTSFNRERFRAQDFDFIAKRIGDLIDHKSLIAWYLFDEPELPKHSVKSWEIKRINELVKALDPSRPTLLTFYMESVIPRNRNSSDVYVNQAYQKSTEKILDEFIFVDKMLQGTPTTAKFNIINLGHFINKDDQAINGALLAMMQGGGLMHWWKEMGSKNNRLLNQHDKYWRELKHLVPIFKASGATNVYQEVPGVLCYEKNIDNERIFIAVNTTDKRVKLKNNVIIEPLKHVIIKY
ncbi:hypothetical protein AAEX28_03900 [Lentisphaerota bacterium WC36G]|nr:hypothetical protein LJT99_06775 [Lentisphaerae bacterium WC36]